MSDDSKPADSPFAIVQQQAEDPGLWFNARTAPEAYLQQALRRLHAAVESSSPPAAPAAQHQIDNDEAGVFNRALRRSVKVVAKGRRDAAPAAQPVAFPGRREVEREMERTENPTGMVLNDSKERVILPGGTLRRMLRMIDDAAAQGDARDAEIARLRNRLEDLDDIVYEYKEEIARLREALEDAIRSMELYPDFAPSLLPSIIKGDLPMLRAALGEK